MLRVPIRSRSGNTLLAVAGAIYVLGALLALAKVVRDAVAFAALLDRAVLVVLVAAAAGGIWFIAVGMTNLRVPRRTRAH